MRLSRLSRRMHSTKFHARSTRAFAALIALSLAHGSPGADDSALTVTSGTAVPEVWTPEQHLYVKGNLGLPHEKLDDLEAWLDVNAPNWTILLSESASGEAFQNHRGMDAVEHALGTGLASKTSFGDLKHPGTNESNGAFFVLFLKERKFSYYASDAYDNRSLGDAQWIGNLDKPAIRAMRDGGRVADAVKRTIENIDGLLARRIAAAETERKQLEETSRSGLEAAEELAIYTREQVREFREANNRPPGDIANPDEAAWNGQLTAVRESFQNGDFADARKGARSLEASLRQHLRLLEDHRDREPALSELRTALENTPPHPQSKAARQSHREALDSLEGAVKAHRNADSGFVSGLAKAQSLLGRVIEENRATINRLELEERHRRQIAQLKKIAAGAAVLLFTGLLVFLNRNRRPSKARAEKLLAARQDAFKARRDRLFELFDRCRSTVGNQVELEESSTSGETRRLGAEAIRDVDELFIMSSSVDRVIDDAEAMIRPRGVVGRIRNLFLKRSFRNACRILEDEPVSFTSAEGIAEILGDHRPAGRPAPLLRENEARESFELSFDELVSRFDEKVDRAAANLDTVGKAWERISEAIDDLGERLDEIVKRHETLLEAGREDGFLLVRSFVEKTVPAIEIRIEEASTDAGSDPVRTLRESVAGTARQLDEMALLIDGLIARRARDIPGMQEASRRLRESGHETEWIPRALEEHSETAEALAVSSSEKSVREALESLLHSLDTLRDAVASADRLSERARGPAREKPAEARSLAEAARRELASALDLEPSAILAESPELNPDGHLARAESLIGPIEAAIDRGGVAAAAAALDEVDALVTEARALIEETRECFREIPGRREQLEAKRQELERELGPHESLLERLGESYAPAALRIALADPESAGGGDEDISNHARFSADALSECRSQLESAGKLYSGGKLFASAAALQRVDDLQHSIEERFAQIATQEEKIRELEASNETFLGEIEARSESLRRAVAEPRVMEATRSALRESEIAFAAAREACDAPSGRADPFLGRIRLVEVETSLSEIDRRIESDRVEHAETERALRQLEALLTEGRRHIRIASADNVPDSPETSSSIRTLEEVEDDLGRLRKQLAIPHGDWDELEDRAAAAHATASRALATLKGELEKAADCLDQINRAAREVQLARRRTGLLTGLILGTTGRDDLSAARDYFQNGDYTGAIRLAQQSRNAALEAITKAKREEARRQRDSMASTRRSGIQGSRSSFGISSGVSRSSFRSGSGVSRSGW